MGDCRKKGLVVGTHVKGQPGKLFAGQLEVRAIW